MSKYNEDKACDAGFAKASKSSKKAKRPSAPLFTAEEMAKLTALYSGIL